MGKQLSGGFDIAAVFSEATINAIFQIFYSAGLLPLNASTNFTHASGDHTLQLYFLRPTLQFVAIEGVTNPIKLRFPFLAQVPTLDAQGPGALTVFVSASKLKAVDENDEEFNFIALDFSGVPASQYEFEFEPMPQLPLAAVQSFTVLDPSIVEQVAAPLAKEMLSNTIDKIPLTPSVPSHVGFFTFRTYVDENFVLPPQGTPYTLPRVFGGYVNIDNDSKNPPAAAPLALSQRIIPHPHNASYLWGEEDQIKVALPETLINARLDDGLVEQGLSPLPATIDIGDGDTVELTALSVSLANGHILVTGEADDVEFTVKIVLAIENDTLQATVIDKDFDVPWYLDFLHVVLPFVGSAIVHSIELSIAQGLDSIGNQAGGLLNGVNVFSNQLPGLEFAPLTIHNNGDIEISPAGLVLQGQLETLLTSAVEPPFFVYGHLESHEFHRRGKDCPYLDKMKPKNTILFMSPAKALSAGYNGCRFCYLDYDEATVGRILLFFRDLTPSPGQEEQEVTVHFEMLQAVALAAEEPLPVFELERTCKGEVQSDGIFYFSDADLPDFLPGIWRVDVRAGTWSTDGEVTVKKWGKQFGKNTFVAFTVGVQGCNKKFGSTPPYPS